MDNLAHKMVDTFEKMDAINPTFEQIHLGIEGRDAQDNLI